MEEQNTHALEVVHLSKTYDSGTVAVDDISFSIRQGEFFGFLGPNGAGKTTTIHCATGIARFGTGFIRLFGHDVVSEYRDTRRMVGLSPQEFNVDIFAHTRHILDGMAGLYGMPKRERRARIDELLERFNLTAHADKSFRALSGGLKRRVMLARAMVHDPRLLILDEPTAGVDVELRHELWRLLREMNAEGKTILLTSHYLEEVQALSGRVAIINNGKIVAIDNMERFTQDGKTLEKTYLEITNSAYA